MPDYKIGTREEWQAARDQLAKLEAEHAELGRKATEQRRQLPWVPVQKEYQFDTEDGKKNPITSAGPAPGARISGMSSTPRASISTTAT
jgi:hypothetical protein